jgi:predicted nucleic acid-binding protein
MAILVDTNILMRSIQPHHPHYALVEKALAFLRTRREALFVAVQNLIEFWAVATRPLGSENGVGMTTAAATRELAAIKDLFPILPEPASVFEEWERLVTTYSVSGKNTHDARLVAVMNLHGIARVLTFNVADFARFESIEAISPENLS